MYIERTRPTILIIKRENREDFVCRPLALPIYSLDLIASVDFFLSLWFICLYRILMPHSTNDLSNTIIISNADIHFSSDIISLNG